MEQEPISTRSPDSTRTAPTVSIPAAFKAFDALMDAIEEVTPRQIAAFRDSLSTERTKRAFDEISYEVQITTVAYQSLPTEITDNLIHLPEYFPIIHDVRTLMAAQKLLRGIIQRKL